MFVWYYSYFIVFWGVVFCVFVFFGGRGGVVGFSLYLGGCFGGCFGVVFFVAGPLGASAIFLPFLVGFPVAKKTRLLVPGKVTE